MFILPAQYHPFFPTQRGSISDNSTLTTSNQENPSHSTCSPRGQGILHHFCTSCMITCFVSFHSAIFCSGQKVLHFQVQLSHSHRLNAEGESHEAPTGSSVQTQHANIFCSVLQMCAQSTIILVMTHLRVERQRGQMHQHRQFISI